MSRYSTPSAFARRTGAPRSAFTLVELLIIVMILGILAVLTIPTFVGANKPASESVLRENLRLLRTQVELFTGQHNGLPPGYPDGDRSAVPTGAAFIAQLTGYTNVDGQVGASYSAATPLRPYLADVPSNPFNNLATVRVVGDADNLPTADGNAFGWFYKPLTRQFVANTPGSDEAGRLYSDY